MVRGASACALPSPGVVSSDDIAATSLSPTALPSKLLCDASRSKTDLAAGLLALGSDDPDACGQSRRQNEPRERGGDQHAERCIRVADHSLNDQQQDNAAEVPGQQQEPDRRSGAFRPATPLSPVQPLHDA